MCCFPPSWGAGSALAGQVPFIQILPNDRGGRFIVSCQQGLCDRRLPIDGSLEDGAVLILTPLLLPTVHTLGINPIHFAIVLTLNIEIAAITPPIGLNLFVINGIAGTTMQEVVAGAFPFVFALMAVPLLLTLFPSIALVLL